VSTRRVFWALAALWTVVWAGALVAVDHIDLQDRLTLARARAEAVLEKDELYRVWMGPLGGVYVVATERTTTNLAGLTPPEPGLALPSGEPLTLVNHAYLTRQLHSEWRARGGLWARLVSLRPLRPENQADVWETEALRRVAGGERRVEEVLEEGDEPHLRSLAPVKASGPCIECHAPAGVRDGEVMGGLSITVPLRPGGPSPARHEALAMAGLSTLWLLGLVGLRRGAGEIRQRISLTAAALQARDRSEQRFRTLLDDLPVGVSETDAAGRCTYVNRRWRELAGITAEQALGQGWTQAIHPEDRERVAGSWQALDHGSTGWEQEYRLLHPEGRTTWVHGTAVTLRDSDGRVTSRLGVSLDITEQRRSQAEAERNELRFQALVQHSSDITLVLSPEGLVRYASPALELVLGHPPDAITGRHWSVLVPPRKRGGRDRAWARLLRTPGRPVHLTQAARHRDGSLRWTELLITNLVADPAVQGLVVNGRDVTAKMAAERSFREVFEESHVGMALGTPEGRVVEINRALGAMLGSPREQLLGQPLPELIHPDDRGVVQTRIEALLEGRANSFQGQYRCLHRQDLEVWGWMTMTLLRDLAGRPQLLVAQVQNITDHRRAEEQLREKAALLEIAQDAICVQRLDGRIEFWNPAAERLYGWSRAEAVGAHADDLLFSRVSRELLQARADNLTHGSWNGELQQAAKDGRIITALCRFSLVRDAGGHPQSILILSTDLTEKKKLEQQFLRAQRLECIGALASGVAHDLNNVFAPIVMAAELLADRSSTSSGLNLVEMVKNSANRGAGIVKQLLAFGRGVSTTPTEFHLEHLFKEIQRLGRETFPKNIQFAVQRDADLWPVIGDPTQLHQVLLNLCVNARDAMPQGGPLTLKARNLRADEVFCRMNPEARPGPYVEIRVNDAGTGIPEDMLDKIFDPFFTTKPLGQGTGLGLPTVLTIVKAHQGFLSVQSQVGKGTEFRVCLPAIERESVASGPVAPATPMPGHGEMVLVVDDEEAICLATQQYLSQFGYTMLTARDGVEAITQFIHNQAKLRIVITDMVMPGMDGAPFIRAIRKLKPEVAIVAMSGILDQKQTAEEAGGPGLRFLMKPFGGNDLVRVLHELLDEGPTPVPPPGNPPA
jgi:PAS domain S-box-containing protein